MKDSQLVGWFWGSIRALAPFEFSAWYRAEYYLHTVWDLGSSCSKISSTLAREYLHYCLCPQQGAKLFLSGLKNVLAVA